MLEERNHRAAKQPSVSLIQTKEVTLTSPSGELKGRLSNNPNAIANHGIIFCPGLAVGLEGDFVKEMEGEILTAGLAKWSLRFNFCGHADDNLNSDLRGFTFSRAVHDFETGIKTLRDAGAETISAVCSSTGTQVAILAACSNAGSFEQIIGRSAVIDCFRSVLDNVPQNLLDIWKQKGDFVFPIGGRQVQLSSDFIVDLEFWRDNYDLSKLKTPTFLIHGERDQTVPLDIVITQIKSAVLPMVELCIVHEADHNLMIGDEDRSRSFILKKIEAYCKDREQINPAHGQGRR